MRLMILLLILCHTASTEKHSLKFYVMISSGVPKVPSYVAMEAIDGVLMGYYDSSMETAVPKEDWVRKVTKNDPEMWEMQVQYCKQYEQIFRAESSNFIHRSNRTEGVIIQQLMGCEWDDVTEEPGGFKQYGYNGEDFLALNMDTEMWVTSNPQAEISRQEWNKNKDNCRFWKNFLVMVCPLWLKTYLNYGKSSLHRRDLPTVSLLQRSPSSPVSCHATGFYPDKAMMFWRRNGEEFHEGVEHGESLQNHDGSYQMTVDLNVSSVTPEDWWRFDCVFQLSGVKYDIIIQLDQAEIRSNWGKPQNKNNKAEPSNMKASIIAAVVVLVFIILGAAGFSVHKIKKNCDTAEEKERGEFKEDMRLKGVKLDELNNLKDKDELL